MLRRLLRGTPLTHDEQRIALTLADRVAFVEKVFRDRNGRPWSARPYQRDSLSSWAARKVHCDGRDVGKTTEIEIVAAWASLMRPETEMLIATQCENHLFPLMERIVWRLRRHPLLRENLLELRRTPSWRIRFRNGFVLWGRIAGPRGRNFQGLHVDWQIVDEAQEMTEAAWRELYQALNAGGMRWVYGVPNGLRNTFYRMTQDARAEQYNWPSCIHPQWSTEQEAELARLYGGKDAPAYLHRVLGQHAQPASGVFDYADYQASVAEVAEFESVVLGEEDPFEPPEAPRGEYYLGCDLGYARDPSELVVYAAEGPDLVNVLRVRLEGVNYARQEDVIAALDEAYAFRMIGIDAGNNGRAVAHQLQQRTLALMEKIRSIEFGGMIDVAPPDDAAGDDGAWTEARRPAKQFMTELIQRRMRERTIVFPELGDREAQYANHTYYVGPHGRILYDKGDDHIIDADRCALLAHHYATTEPPPPVPLPMRVEFF